jgi:hypothetical protein
MVKEVTVYEAEFDGLFDTPEEAIEALASSLRETTMYVCEVCGNWSLSRQTAHECCNEEHYKELLKQAKFNRSHHRKNNPRASEKELQMFEMAVKSAKRKLERCQARIARHRELTNG